MKFPAILWTIALLFPARAAELDEKILSLIGAEARAVFGMDVVRYQGSGMYGQAGAIHPPGASEIISVASTEENRLMIVRGFSEWKDSIALDPLTRVSGDVRSVNQAAERWAHTAARQTPLARRAQALSSEYDLWFVVEQPFVLLENRAPLENPEPRVSLKFKDQLIRSIEEVSGGIRLGKFDEFRVDASMRTAEDAEALASLARWLPGFLQLQEPRSPQSMLLETVQDLEIAVRGRTVSISFSIEDDQFRALGGPAVW